MNDVKEQNTVSGNGESRAGHEQGRNESHSENHGEVTIPKDLPHPSSGTVVMIGVVVVILFAGIFVVGLIPHLNRQKAIHADAAEIASGVPVVEVVAPKTAAAVQNLVLPSDVRANQTTAIFPRANGYLKTLYVDIQDRVKAGQLLAEIDAPEIDAELAQGKAALEQSRASYTKAQSDVDLAQKTYARFEEAAQNGKGSVTAQQLDERKAALDQVKSALVQAKANIVAAEADVQRLTVTQGFQKVTAPFDGIITARNYDVGALLNPSNTTAGSELFGLAQVDTMRVFVNVPQSYSTQIKTGQKATLSVRNYPGKKFEGTVVRTAGALNEDTRTLTFELHFPNPDGALYAGMYGQATLPVTTAEKTLVIPSSALVFNAGGLQVASVSDDKVKLKKITVGRDLGTEVEIASGIDNTDTIISNPSDALSEGSSVKINAKETPQQGATGVAMK
jgi:membrane fusion protein (multidrug efflux system)